MADTRYAVWQAARKGAAPDPQRDENICGFWRIQAAKTKPDTPVAIWPQGERQVLKIGRMPVIAEGSQLWFEFIAGSWPHCMPVTKAEYDAAIEHGIWPSDGKASRQLTLEEKAGVVPGQKPGEGSNEPPPEELLSDKIAALAEIIERDKEPETQAQADNLAERLFRLKALLDTAEAKRVEEKKPYREAAEAVDAKWKKVQAPGLQAKLDADGWISRFLKKEQARLREIAAKEAEVARQEAAKRAAAIAAENNLSETEAASLAKVAEKTIAPIEVPKATAGGAFSRSKGLKTVRRAVIDDMSKLAAHFIETKDADFTNYMQARAQSAVRAKSPLPGTHSEDDEK